MPREQTPPTPGSTDGSNSVLLVDARTSGKSGASSSPLEVTYGELISRMEFRWFQMGLSTFFWAGVVNALFCAGALYSLHLCLEVKANTEVIQQKNIEAERNLRDLLHQIQRQRYEAREEFNQAVKWWQETRAKN